jgi:L-arabinose transport system permease protein
MATKSLANQSKFARLWDAAGMLVVFAVLFILCCIFVENFTGPRSLVALALAVTTIGMIACTMMFCLAAGEFDLSVGSTVAFAGVLGAITMNTTGSVIAGVLATLAAGSVIGLTNGVLIARFGINALIATLATMQIVRGLGLIITGGIPVGIQSAAFYELGIGAGVPVAVTVTCFVVFGVLLTFTVFGRNALAIGGNKEAAHLAGVSVTRVKVLIFTLQGFVAALAGLVLSARMSSGQPNVGQGLELEVISACVLGGVSLNGGVARISAVIAGVLIMGLVQHAMNLMAVATFYQYVVRGSILLAAVMLDRLKHRA